MDFDFYTVEIFNSHHSLYFFQNLKKAQNFLWEYYLENGGKNEPMDVQTERYCYLINLNLVENYGMIYGEYFEDGKDFC